MIGSGAIMLLRAAYDPLSVPATTRWVRRAFAAVGVNPSLKTENDFVQSFRRALEDPSVSGEGKLFLAVSMYRREAALHRSLLDFVNQHLLQHAVDAGALTVRDPEIS
jgi:hypothetical protein